MEATKLMSNPSAAKPVKILDNPSEVSGEPLLKGFMLALSGILDRSYSYLNATIGSTFAALLAGMKHATSTTRPNNNVTPAKATASVALTP